MASIGRLRQAAAGIGRPPGHTLSRGCDELQRAGLLGSIVERASEALAARAQRAQPVAVLHDRVHGRPLEPGALPCVSPRRNSSAMRSFVCWRDRRVRLVIESPVLLGWSSSRTPQSWRSVQHSEASPSPKRLNCS